MEIRYSNDKSKMIDPAKLNGHAHVQEASRLAAPLAHFEAYRMAKAYGTPMVGWDEKTQRVTYVDPEKYSFEDIKAGRYKDDPSIYIKPECLFSPKPN